MTPFQKWKLPIANISKTRATNDHFTNSTATTKKWKSVSDKLMEIAENLAQGSFSLLRKGVS